MSCKTFQRFWHILTWEIAYYSFLSGPNIDNKIPRVFYKPESLTFRHQVIMTLKLMILLFESVKSLYLFFLNINNNVKQISILMKVSV